MMKKKDLTCQYSAEHVRHLALETHDTVSVRVLKSIKFDGAEELARCRSIPHGLNVATSASDSSLIRLPGA